jgi:RNA polymerase sigma factor (sigma-70 family)
MSGSTQRNLLIGGDAATLPALPLIADTIRSETPFPYLELSEDASRIPGLYQPENFEWWYFDAQLTDGRTLVLVFYIDQDAGERRFVYRAPATVASPTGQRVNATDVTHQDASISRERPEIHIGKSFLRGDLDTYRVVTDASDLGKLGLDVTIRRTFPPRVSPANRESIVPAGKIIGWVCPVPHGHLTGTPCATLSACCKASGLSIPVIIVVTGRLIAGRKRTPSPFLSIEGFSLTLPPAYERDSPRARYQRGEATLRLRTALASLPEKYRTIILLRDLEQLSLAEVAHQLKLTISGVKTRQIHARRRAATLLLQLDQSPLRNCACQ